MLQKVKANRGLAASSPQASPEKPSGRAARSPRAGKSALALRSAVSSAPSGSVAPLAPGSPSLAEFLQEDGSKPAVAPALPGFKANVDLVNAGPNPLLSTAAASTGLANDVFADIGGRCSVPTHFSSMTVDGDDESDNVSEASEVQDDVSLKDVMRRLNTMEKRQKVSNKKLREATKVVVAEAVNPIWDQLRSTQEDVTQLGRSAVIHDDRLGKLETAMCNLNVGAGSRPDKNDPNHCRIAFKGFSTESVDSRYDAIKPFIEKYVGKDAYICIDTRMKGGFDDRKPTNESYVQFGSRDARDRVLKAVKGNNFKTDKGNIIKVYRSKTEWQRGRDWAMRKSEELINGKLQSAGRSATVKFEKGKDFRKITVNGADAFVQRLNDAHGRFGGEFADLMLP